jgi:hypothetical protein
LKTGSTAQWVALGIGVYAAFSWAHNLAFADPVTFKMIFKSKTIMFSVIGFPCIAFITYGLGFWGPPYVQRIHGVSASEAGMILGLCTAIGGWFGVTMGGVITDKLRVKYVKAKFYVGMFSALSSIPIAYTMLATDNLTTAYVANFFLSMTSPMWIGPASSTIVDMVLPRMRAIASAFYLLMVTFIGLALGPYTIGYLSDGYTASGMASADALRLAMTSSLFMLGIAAIALYFASRFVESEENSRLSRARALGEDI